MKKSKLLLIDDEPHLLRNTADLLELSGYAIQTAQSGREGVQLALTSKPDLILCDITMTGLDGYGVLQIIKSHPDLKSIPFIFLTAKAKRTDLRKGMELGADDYLAKPFGETELLGAIEARLRLAEQRDSLTKPETLQKWLTNEDTTKALALLGANRKVVRYKKKRVIYAAGDEPTRVYLVQEGKIRVFRENDSGKVLTTGLFGPGDLFGYPMLLANLSYEDTATALEDSLVSYISRKDFLSLLYSQTDITHSFLNLMANTIVGQDRQLLGLAYNSLRKRIASGLLQYAHRFQTEPDTAITVKLTRQQMATLSGTATESLIRTLSDFHKEGMIDLQAGKIVITDWDKLEQLRQ
ncbi:response regulator [Spirosoma pollinicola]|uniref:Transcriptional regulator n=1 Tax=Spirosoma pollinicola TaxID=2057025 RepID=A0A2K8Z472_9BACT|nr:response regulator [Spirosoma pollinicola]AUD04663.1 transcriptional regulator [Spirosoma pollinicola]